jgi:hypothetical protein
MKRVARTVKSKRTARNDWGLLHLRASMLYHVHLDHAPVRTKRFWANYLKAKREKDIQDAFLETLAFESSFKRV